MSKPKFKVGDRVKLDGVEYCLERYGIPKKYAKKIGTVSRQYKSGSILVEFDDGRRFFAPDYLGVAINKKIIIYRNGAEVVAKNTATGKTGVAKCNPADEFDFNTGAKLAFERLTNSEPEKPKKPKYYTGKVVCVKAMTKTFTKGKIYEIVDGKMRPNAGFGDICTYKDFDDVNLFNCSQFIELVE